MVSYTVYSNADLQTVMDSVAAAGVSSTRIVSVNNVSGIWYITTVIE